MKKPPLVVYCDFDGTITQVDVIDFILEELADPSWKEIEDLWEKNEISSHECLAKQIPLIKGGWKRVEKLLEEIDLDPTFKSFSNWCNNENIPLVIVSDGLDRIIHTLLTREKIFVSNIWSNHLIELNNGILSIDFPYPPFSRDCQAGLCKCQILEESPKTSLKVIIGDGQSDMCWGNEADLLFAKSKLLKYCKSNNIPHKEFKNFNEIRHELEKVLALHLVS